MKGSFDPQRGHNPEVEPAIIYRYGVGSTKVLMLTDSSRETRNVKHAGLSFQRKRYITRSARRLGVAVANSLSNPSVLRWGKP